MTHEYKVLEKAGRIFVILAPGCKVEKEKILALLREIGIDATTVTFLSPDDVNDSLDFEDALVILPVDQEVCELPELVIAGQTCAQGGGRVVVLFGDGFSCEGIHPIADKYGTQCGWSPKELILCISDQEGDNPRSGSGSPVARPKVTQVKC